MINIINHGTKYNITICSKCHCQFSYEDSDLTEYLGYYKTKYDPKEDRYYDDEIIEVHTHSFHINCPDCNEEMIVREYADRKIPEDKEKLNDRST